MRRKSCRAANLRHKLGVAKGMSREDANLRKCCLEENETAFC